MKALVLHAVGDLRYEDVPDPSPEPGEVLLKVRASGVCGSDIARVFEKGTYHFPTIPGHEFAGEVIGVGSTDDSALIGTRAAVFPMLPCRKCTACEVGEYAQCENYDYYGSRRDGGFAEYIAVKKWNLAPIPDNVSYEEAAMCEPCAVAVHALSQVGLTLGDTVAIYGSGTIGLLLAKFSLIWGAGRVILADIDKRKLSAANRFGFPDTVDAGGCDAPEAVRDLTNGRGADVVIEGTGSSAALENCFKSAKTFGRVVLMGNPLRDMSVGQKGYWEILRKQLTVKGTWNSGFSGASNDWTKAISLMPRLGLGAMITHRFPLRIGAMAVDTLRGRDELSLKVMYVMGQ